MCDLQRFSCQSKFVLIHYVTAILKHFGSHGGFAMTVHGLWLPNFETMRVRSKRLIFLRYVVEKVPIVVILQYVASVGSG